MPHKTVYLQVELQGKCLLKNSDDDYDYSWGDVSGGGGYQNLVDIPPSNPSAWDDEFEGTTLDSKWTIMRSSVLTYNFEGGVICMNSSNWWSGIYQPIPTGDFIATVKVYRFLG